MKILHTYCLNYNIGDHFLGIGVKNLLRKYLDVELIAETNLQGTVFNEYFIKNVVNKKYDLLVIGGGGIIHGAHWPNGWFWLIKEELIETIKIPFIVYGAGYNYFKDEGEIPEVGKRHLKKTIEKAAYFSLRNDGSVERFIEQIGIQVPEVPDPGFHINLNKQYTCPEKSPFILVQLATDKPEYRFGNSERYNEYVNEMREILKDLSDKYHIILSPHVYDDVFISRKVSEGLKNTSIWNFSQYAFDNCEACIGYYRDAQFVLAMRGHGQIIPMAFNTPVISLENHPKHYGLMKKLGLENYNVSLSDPNFSEHLKSIITRVENSRNEYVERLEHISEALFVETKQAFEEIKKRI